MGLIYNIKDVIKWCYIKYHYGKIQASSFKYRDQFKDEIMYMKENGICIFPYEYTKKYCNMEIPVFNDEKSGMTYAIVDKGKRLFVPDSKRTGFASFVRDLMMEQDPESPHVYFTETFKPERGCFVDVGCADGMTSLSIVDQVDCCYLFETDKDWCFALEQTFREYNNVHICNMFVGKYTDEEKGTISLDDVIRDYSVPLFFKIDVEGHELETLEGLRSVLEKAIDVKLAIAVYHTPTEGEQCRDYLEKMGYTTEWSKGYMFYYYTKFGTLVPPYFRHGILRAWKNH